MRIDEMIAARRLAAQVRPFQEYPKYITVDGKQVLVQSVEEELAHTNEFFKPVDPALIGTPLRMKLPDDYVPTFAATDARIADDSAPKLDKRTREYKNSLKD